MHGSGARRRLSFFESDLPPCLGPRALARYITITVILR